MDFEPEEQKIIDLLSKLKDQDGVYPKKLLASRRQVFLSQMASIGAGLGIGLGLKSVAKASKSGLFHLSSISVSSILETILVLAIVAQAGVIAYSYRGKIADFVNTLSSATATQISAPVVVSTEPGALVSNTPTVAATKTASPSPSPLPSITVTTVTKAPSEPGNVNGGGTTNSTAPAAATVQPTNDNNGNHYGQTPRPTQEPSNSEPTQGGGNGGGNGGGKKP